MFNGYISFWNKFSEINAECLAYTKVFRDYNNIINAQGVTMAASLQRK
jgi:hypothetical protein